MSKYDEVLKPFLALMEKELHANAGKGDRPGWLAMTPGECLLEIFYHMGKLQKAVKHNDDCGIREYSADVANMAMMLVDICGLLPAPNDATAWNSPDVLPPVGCPIVLRIGCAVVQAERTAHIERRDREMTYKLPTGQELVGRYPWTYQ